MSPLQWALLIFGVVAVVAVYLYSRRDRRAMDDWNPNESEDPLLPPPKERQLDIFNGVGGGQQFDEFGVGKPRRVTPSLTPEGEEGAPASIRPQQPGARTPPSVGKAPVSEKIISLLIAEREGTAILGPKIHDALEAQGLEYGARQIYHRLLNGEPVFSVASLLKPGYLDPKEAAGFTTPGLTVFMVLPGPVHPVTAFQDMLTTTQALARALNADVYDGKRRPMNTALAHTMQMEVETFARESLR
jgi:cell division protein ZipA